MREMTASDQEILEQLMELTTVDLINVTAYLAMSLGESGQVQGKEIYHLYFSSRDVLQWNYLGDRRQEIYPTGQPVFIGSTSQLIFNFSMGKIGFSPKFHYMLVRSVVLKDEDQRALPGPPSHHRRLHRLLHRPAPGGCLEVHHPVEGGQCGLQGPHGAQSARLLSLLGYSSSYLY